MQNHILSLLFFFLIFKIYFLNVFTTGNEILKILLDDDLLSRQMHHLPDIHVQTKTRGFEGKLLWK